MATIVDYLLFITEYTHNERHLGETPEFQTTLTSPYYVVVTLSPQDSQSQFLLPA